MGRHKTASKIWTSDQDVATKATKPGLDGFIPTADEKLRPSWADIVRESAALRSKAFSENVCMQGLAPICDPKSSWKRRSLWALIVTLAVTFTAYNIFKQIDVFLQTPINVLVDYDRANSLTFPTVTLCNNNFASLKVVKAFGAVKQLKDTKPLLFEVNASTPNYTGFDFTLYHKYGWDSFYRSFGQNMTAMLMKCQWELSHCDLDNFTEVFTDMGLCYSFNVDGSLQARQAGRSYGLKVTLDAQQADYLRSMDQYYGAGFRVVVHAPGVPPILSEKGVAVSAGYQNFLAIDIKQLVNAEPSVSNCGSKEMKYYTSGYSTEACRIECRTDFVSSRCGCRDLYMPSRNIRICDPPEFYLCIFPTLDEYLQGNNICEDACPDPCSETIYHVTPSSNPFSENFLQEFSEIKGRNASYWSKNLVHIEIYLTSMTYEKVEKQLGYTLLQLFCDVGGAFGLLLGASLLTILEIIDFFICQVSSVPAVKPTRKINKIQVKPIVP